MTFEFYLAGWMYCVKNNVPLAGLKKTGFKEWTLIFPTQEASDGSTQAG